MRAPFIVAGLGALAVYAIARTPRGQALAADAAGFVVNALTPRGIRNNNPGNIEWIENPAKRWRGMIGRDGRYGVFDTPANGVRAIGGELQASINRGQSLESAIHEWAPAVENDTDAYVDHVEALTSIPRDSKLRASYKAAIASAIIQHENGQQPYSAVDIAAWVNS